MSFISGLMDRIRQAAQTAITPVLLFPGSGRAGPGPQIVYGSDPPADGVCMIQGAGFAPEEYMDTGKLCSLPVLVNGKSEDQYTVLERLTAIHEALTKTFDYAALSDEHVQVISIRTTASPSVIGREQNRQWICGSSLEVTFYWR
jgi:hypothetical protein